MSYLYAKLIPFRGFAAYPVKIRHIEFFPFLVIRKIIFRNKDNVFLNILICYIPGTAGQSQSFSLSNGVKPEAAMNADLLSGLFFNNIAWLFSEMIFYKIPKTDLSKKTEALTVLSVFIGQVKF